MLKASKTQAEKETMNAEAIVSRLNKDLTKQKNLTEVKQEGFGERYGNVKYKLEVAAVCQKFGNNNTIKKDCGDRIGWIKKSVWRIW